MKIDEYLKDLPATRDDSWFNTLDARKKEEASFHDYIRSEEAGKGEVGKRRNLKFYKITQKSKAYVRSWLRKHVIGKVFLDYACGDGRHSEDVLKYSCPRLLVGLDISSESIKICNEKLAHINPKCKKYFVQGDCENTGFPDNSFDIILCSEMLHHLDLHSAFLELHRILAPGGRILCVEALGINPIIQWYRNKTPDLRTEFETHHILTPKAFKIAEDCGFAIEEVKYWHLFAIPATFCYKYKFLFDILLTAGNALDCVFLKIPGFQKLAWQFTFILRKR